MSHICFSESANRDRWDIISVSHQLARPHFPLGQSYWDFLETEVAPARQKRRHQDELNLPINCLDLDEESKDLITDMRIYCDLIDLYCEASASAPRREVLAIHRNLIQYRLLSRDTGTGTYELCRIVALIFSYGVIFPLPDAEPMTILLRQLEAAIQEAKQTDEFLLWTLMLGGIGARGTSREPSFVKELVRLTSRMRLRSWDKARDILCEYLWNGTACDQGALGLWTQVTLGARESISASNNGVPDEWLISL